MRAGTSEEGCRSNWILPCLLTAALGVPATKPQLMWCLSDYGDDKHARLTPSSEAAVRRNDSLLSIGGLEALLRYPDIQSQLHESTAELSHFLRESLLHFMRDEQAGPVSCHASPVQWATDDPDEDVVHRIVESRVHRGRVKYKGRTQKRHRGT